MTYAVFAWDDPMPAFVELPITLARAIKRLIAWNFEIETKTANSSSPARADRLARSILVIIIVVVFAIVVVIDSLMPVMQLVIP